MATTPPHPGRWSRPDWLALAGLFLAPWLFLWPLFAPGGLRRYFVGGDFVDQFVAFAAHEVRSLAAGRAPLWNPYAYGGGPFWADIQAAVAYPLSLLNVLAQAALGHDLLRLFTALEVEAVLHLSLAAVFTYLFARRVLAHRGGAVLAGLTFVLGGYLTGYPPLQLAVLETVIWLPLALLAVEWIVDCPPSGRRRWTGPVLLALALGMAVLAGHPQSALHVLVATAAWAVYRTWPWRQQARHVWPGLVVGLAGAAGLSAAGWLPAVQFLRLSNRAEASYDSLANGFPPAELLGAVLPGITLWAPLYVGVLPLLLAVAAAVDAFAPAVIGDRGRRDARFWLGLALVALLVALGRHAFAFDLFYLAVPGFDLFRGQERAAFPVSFALAMLAGRGAALWWTGEPRARRVLANGAVVLAGLGLVLALAARPELRSSALRLLFVAGGVAALAALSADPRRSGRAVLVAALGLVAVDLYLAGAAVNLAPAPPAELRSSGLADVLRGVSQRVDDDAALHAEEGFRPNFGVLHAIEATSGASPLRLRAFEALRGLATTDEGRWWDLWAVSQVVTPRTELPRPAEPREAWDTAAGRATLYYLPQHTPPVWRANAAEVTAADDQALARLAGPGFDPLTTVLLADGAPGGPYGGRAGVGLTARRPGEVVAETYGDEPGWVVFAESHYPGWRATVDGQPAPVSRANVALMAVAVPAGEHTVRLWFTAPWVTAGLALSLITALALAALLARTLRNTGT